jgi:HSP90 family molecular chaperone
LPEGGNRAFQKIRKGMVKKVKEMLKKLGKYFAEVAECYYQLTH